ncbi:hypothetical protein FRC03_003841 [Tulasnella sp. 419]|nr:hypothetical protein FRC03_003841 [Tulasnella sp. 419]
MSLLCFDLFITFFLTALFVWPLWASKLISPKLKRVARRTLVASAVALSTSAINIGVLTYMHGRQLGWVCLTSCGSDVTVNAVVLFWVTAGSQSNRSNPHANPHGPATASFSPGSALTGGTGVARTARVSGEHIEVIDVQTGLTDQEQRKRSLDGRRGLEKIGYRREMDIGDGGRHDSDDDDEMKDFTRSMSEKWRRSIDRISLDDMKSGSTPPPDQRHVQLPTIVTHERSQPTRSKMFGLHRFSNAFGHHENRKETTSAPVTGEELSTMEFNHESQTSAPDGKHRKKPSRGSSISSLQQIRNTQRSDHNRQTENRYSPTVAFQTSTFGPLPDPLYRFPPLPVTSESMTSPYHDSSQPYVPPKPDSSYVFGG